MELSGLQIEALTDAKPLIDEFLAKDYQGSIPGSFNRKKCKIGDLT